MSKKLIKATREIYVPAKQIKRNIVDVMQTRIGQGNAITQADLFKEIYGNPKDFSDIELFYMWGRVTSAIRSLRTATACVIVPHRAGKQWSYFIPKTKSDLVDFEKAAKKQVRNIQTGVLRVQEAVDKKFYKQVKLMAR